MERKGNTSKKGTGVKKAIGVKKTAKRIVSSKKTISAPTKAEKPATTGNEKYAPKSDEDRFLIMQKIAECVLQGKRQAPQIIEELLLKVFELSRRSIYYYIKESQEEWAKQREKARDLIVAEQLAKIDLIEKNAWEDLGRSREDFQKSISKTDFNPPQKQGEKASVKANAVTKTTEQRNANAEYYRVLQWCVEKRLEIAGYGSLNLTVQNNQFNQTTNVVAPALDKFAGNIMVYEAPPPPIEDAEIIESTTKTENL